MPNAGVKMTLMPPKKAFPLIQRSLHAAKSTSWVVPAIFVTVTVAKELVETPAATAIEPSGLQLKLQIFGASVL